MRKEEWSGYDGPIIEDIYQMTSEDIIKQDHIDYETHDFLCQLTEMRSYDKIPVSADIQAFPLYSKNNLNVLIGLIITICWQLDPRPLGMLINMQDW